MTSIREAWKYSRAASDAVLGNRYSWRITKSYLDAYGNEEKNLDPVTLDKYIRDCQDMLSGVTLVLAGLTLMIPVKWIVKRKIRKRSTR